MTPLNCACFSPENIGEHELRARGITEHGQNGGMSHIQRDHLIRGQYYYRFCDSKRFSLDEKREMSGGWWIEYETFLKIRDAARRQETIRDYARKQGQSGLSYAAKLYLAVPYEWGDCGILVSACLKARLDAFKGRGLTVRVSRGDKADRRDGGANFVPIQDPTIGQLYIPGLKDVFASAFTFVTHGDAARFA